MATVALLDDPQFERHVPPYEHPENPDRLRAIRDALGAAKVFEGQPRIEARPATGKEVGWVHDPDLFKRVERTAGLAASQIDGDTYTSHDSFETACMATGGLLEAVRAVMEKRAQRSVSLIRPPGHHAERDRAMGFCLFNNVAVAAEYLRREWGIKRILIVDWDVHHGNGTQHSFYDTREVLFFSSHQFPLYPGTGSLKELGRDEGEGFTVNVPLPPGLGDEVYLPVYQHFLREIAEEYEPQFILVSAGFDAHADDPLANMRVSSEGFAAMAHAVAGIADRFCEGRLAVTLEGGYDLDALAESVTGVCQALRADSHPDPDAPGTAGISAIRRLEEACRDHWKILRKRAPA